jgi:hypothetical protein
MHGIFTTHFFPRIPHTVVSQTMQATRTLLFRRTIPHLGELVTMLPNLLGVVVLYPYDRLSLLYIARNVDSKKERERMLVKRLNAAVAKAKRTDVV